MGGRDDGTGSGADQVAAESDAFFNQRKDLVHVAAVVGELEAVGPEGDRILAYVKEEVDVAAAAVDGLSELSGAILPEHGNVASAVYGDSTTSTVRGVAGAEQGRECQIGCGPHGAAERVADVAAAAADGLGEDAV